MQKLCHERYGLTSSSSKVDDRRMYVRVLWDIENIPIEKSIGALSTVSKLQSFLEAKCLFGKGIDFQITAFGNVNNRKIRGICEDLDKAGVEIVWSGRKREDADRKLVKRLLQYVNELPCDRTSLIIISSDQDFRNEFQLAIGRGFDVTVLHNARTPRWTQVMCLQRRKLA